MKHIIVLQAGWVFVGTPSKDGKHYTAAANVRVWGTTKGLGQLALEGPTQDTVLDPCGTFTPAPSAVLFTMPCPGWK